MTDDLDDDGPLPNWSISTTRKLPDRPESVARVEPTPQPKRQAPQAKPTRQAKHVVPKPSAPAPVVTSSHEDRVAAAVERAKDKPHKPAHVVPKAQSKPSSPLASLKRWIGKLNAAIPKGLARR